MVQSFEQVDLHIAFGTRERRPLLRDASLRAELYALAGTVMQRLKCPAKIINGVEDHVHVLCSITRSVAIMDLVRELKFVTSKWLNKQHAAGNFAWQSGYGVFSVSRSQVPRVIRYIANQEAHHRTQTFQEEFRKLCELHGIQFDERYAWK